MNRELFIEYTPDLIRAAVTEDGQLCEIHSEPVGSVKATESLYYGRVKQIRTSVGAAFVDIGLEQNGFLPLDETKALRCGDFIIVQGAAKQAVDSKGLRLTARINLAGKWLVLAPGEEGVHISKKVKDAQLRSSLYETASDVRPDGCALIVRTASSDVTPDRLREEAQNLHEKWLNIQKKAAGMIRPGLLSERLSLDERLVRDLASPLLSRIVVNDSEKYAKLSALKSDGLIFEHTKIEHFDEKDALLFDACQIEERISKALRRTVWLDCGGYIVIESCEAMTVIDVNSGKMVLGRGIEDTALRVNLEAAREIARQIRLRDVGGMIVVDFIDMKSPEHQDMLTSALRDAVKADRTQVQVFGLTKLGIMEMTRRRVHAELRKALRVTCSACGGDGEILAPGEVARRALMQVRRKVLAGQRGPFVVSLSRKAARALAEMTGPEGCDVFAYARENCRALDATIEQIETAESVPKGALKLKKVKHEENASD